MPIFRYSSLTSKNESCIVYYPKKSSLDLQKRTYLASYRAAKMDALLDLAQQQGIPRGNNKHLAGGVVTFAVTGYGIVGLEAENNKNCLSATAATLKTPNHQVVV